MVTVSINVIVDVPSARRSKRSPCYRTASCTRQLSERQTNVTLAYKRAFSVFQCEFIVSSPNLFGTSE